MLDELTPVITVSKDGTMPLAITPDGRDVPVTLYDLDGSVEHALICGTANTGKSVTLAAQVLPGVIEDLEVVFYIDGLRGTSAPYLAGVCDWWAIDGPQGWTQAIDSAHAVMRARQARRAIQKQTRWHGRTETDPILTLAIDEATAAKAELDDAAQAKVLAILGEGRRVGVRVIQVTPDLFGDSLIGGRTARMLTSGSGTLFGHRPDKSTVHVIANPGSLGLLDLHRLPTEPGWCAIIRRGRVLTRAARIKPATDRGVEQALATATRRTLTGCDLAAAGPGYANRVQGPHGQNH